MLATLKLHKQKISFLFLLLSVCFGVTWYLGQAKPWSQIDWMDVIGEGGSACAMALWITFILGSRPQGRVTNLLTLGLGFMMVAFWQDALDEFIRLPSHQWWDQWLESVTMPVGILLLTYGLYHWYQEQLQVNHTLKKREQLFRDHAWIDRITHLSRVDFLKKQLRQIGRQQEHDNISLIMIDVAQFSIFNRIHGQTEGDRLLYQLAEFLQLNMREQDLLTRYAADRFSIILPRCHVEKANLIALQLEDAVAHFHFRLQTSDDTYLPRIVTGIACTQGFESTCLIDLANKDLTKKKSSLNVA
jgi:diguanylate cyclase (GGDEF)-like protein